MRKSFTLMRFTICFLIALSSFTDAASQCLSYAFTTPTNPTYSICVSGNLSFQASVFTPTVQAPNGTYCDNVSQEWITTGGGNVNEDPANLSITSTWTSSGTIYNYVTWREHLSSGGYISRCGKSTEYTVTVFYASLSPTTASACQDPGVTLTASTNMTSPAPTYKWYQGTLHGGTLITGATSDTYTVTGVVTNETYRVNITSGGCSITSSTSTVTTTTNTIDPYTASVNNTTYCASQGVTVSLNGSQAGVSYFLYVGGTQVGSSDSTPPIEWTGVLKQGDGTVSVMAYKGGCQKQMSGHPVINVALTSAPDNSFSVQGGGSFCASTGIEGERVENGVNIKLSGSETGVTYTLLKSGISTGVSLAGTGKPLTFPGQPAGTYTVVGNRGSIICSANMQQSATVTEKSPLVRWVLTGNDFCSGEPGGILNLLGSTSGKTYQLYKESVPWGLPRISLGSPIQWDSVAAGGQYSVIATGSATECPTVMSGLITIHKNQAKRFNVIEQGDACSSGATIKLVGSEPGVTYQLKKDSDPPTQQKADNNNAAITWTTTLNGKYTVVANKAGCTREMNYVRVKRPALSINVDQYPCFVHFEAVMDLGNCGITSYDWDFGDGTMHSTSPEPFHDYATSGVKNITLTVTSNCNGVSCTTVATTSITVNLESYTYADKDVSVYTTQRQKIINTSASTFSDAWQLPYELNYSSITNPFLTGERGVWRNEGQYAYKANRSQSTPVNIATDGTFTMNLFNWEQSKADAVPNWVKGNTITRYSPYSYELENKDVMDIYSSAVYDYSGQLVSAQGSNMRNDEMAFTGFETPVTGITGNWVFGSTPIQSVKTYPVLYGSKHMAIVAGHFDEFTGVNAVDVNSFFLDPASSSLFFFKGLNTNRIIDDPVVCKKVYSNNNEFTVIILNNAPHPGTWIGSITVRTSVPGVAATLNGTVVHTGKQSLMATGLETYPQRQLALDSNKWYFVSAWVAIGNNASYAKPHLRDSLGINIFIKGKFDVPDITYKFRANGPIIEGWQQVQGRFLVPTSHPDIDIAFKGGKNSTDVAWFDDLRLHPDNGIMKSYVYDLKDYRLIAILDEQNFASLFYYDSEGNLFLTKKDTERGRKTISENSSHIKATQP